jgi:V8-like Glu-specific endopeptidase
MRAKHCDAVVSFVLIHYPIMPTKDIANALGLTCCAVYQIANLRGVKKAHSYKRDTYGNRLMQAGIPTRFKAGQRAWNKGLKKAKNETT